MAHIISLYIGNEGSEKELGEVIDKISKKKKGKIIKRVLIENINRIKELAEKETQQPQSQPSTTPSS